MKFEDAIKSECFSDEQKDVLNSIFFEGAMRASNRLKESQTPEGDCAAAACSIMALEVSNAFMGRPA